MGADHWWHREAGRAARLSRPTGNDPGGNHPAEGVFAITMLTAIRPGGTLFLRGFFEAARRSRSITDPLRRLAFIRAAHWTIVDTLPDGEGNRQPLRPPYLLFESHYDVDLGEYIEMFARRVPWQMRGAWSTAYGYPGVIPAEVFHRWVDDHRLEDDHYWRAYSEGTTKTVEAGLRVADRLRTFDAVVAGVDDYRFAVEYQRLLIELQGDF
jgi:hypothetical protein